MKYLLSFVIFLPLFLFCSNNGFAQDYYLELEPAIIEIKKNELLREKISLSNNGKNLVQLSPVYYFLEDYKAENNSYGLIKDTKSEISKNIKIYQNDSEISSIILQPLEKTSLEIEAKSSELINKGILVGFAQVNQPTESDSETQVVINPIISTMLIFNNSPSFSMPEVTILPDHNFTLKVPLEFSIKVKNNNDINRINGNISIYNIFNQKVADLPIRSELMLAETELYLKNESGESQFSYSEPIVLGPYRIEARLEMDGYTKTFTSSLFVAPLIFMAIVTLIFFVILSIYFKALKTR